MKNYKTVVRIWNQMMTMNGFGKEMFVGLAEVMAAGGRVEGGILVRNRCDGQLWVVCPANEFAYPYNR